MEGMRRGRYLRSLILEKVGTSSGCGGRSVILSIVIGLLHVDCIASFLLMSHVYTIQRCISFPRYTILMRMRKFVLAGGNLGHLFKELLRLGTRCVSYQ